MGVLLPGFRSRCVRLSDAACHVHLLCAAGRAGTPGAARCRFAGVQAKAQADRSRVVREEHGGFGELVAVVGQPTPVGR